MFEGSEKNVEALDLATLTPSAYKNVVAVEPNDDGSAKLFIRSDAGVEVKTITCQPFLWLKTPSLLDNWGNEFELLPLAGNGEFKYLAKFANSSDYESVLKFLKISTGCGPSSPQASHRVISDSQQRAMVAGGFRLFRGMTFERIRRLQFDIETSTTPGFEFPNPQREGDRIIIISFSDNTGWERTLSLNEMGEKELLEEFVRIIIERDPDVIEGHNLFRFDLSFIEERAKRHKVKLAIGREGRVVKKRNSRFSAAERTINYPRFDAYGRHFIDTFHLTQLYDVVNRELESYGLKSVARHFSVAAPERTYVAGEEISSLWDSDPERVKAYCMDDVRETRAIAAILSPSYFYQAQLLPISYQNCVVRGNATRIDGMLTAAYFAERHSLPSAEMGRQFSGALTKAFETGVFQNIWHCDVRSLYPSIILAENWCPERDELGVFPKFLETLRDFRLNAKDAAKKATSNSEKEFFNSLQGTFKILINSFYGYLGFSQGTFNDYNMAEMVTARGREILTLMLEHLEKNGARVIEMDTDGIYFQPPEGEDNPVAMEESIQAALPVGIEVELDETYAAMFAYKSKNYALLSDQGEVSITGAALKSRGLEPFQREYMKNFIGMILKDDFEGIERLDREFEEAISSRNWPLTKLAKSETLNESPENYRKKLDAGKGRRSAAYELALGATRNYRQGDQLSFYVTGGKKRVSVVENSRLLSDAPPSRDENTAYYLGKLSELQKKFEIFLPERTQFVDDLFSFSNS